MLGLLLLSWLQMALRDWPGPEGLRSEVTRILLHCLVRLAVFLIMGTQVVLLRVVILALQGASDPFAAFLHEGLQLLWASLFEGWLLYVCFLLIVCEVLGPCFDPETQEAQQVTQKDMFDA